MDRAEARGTKFVPFYLRRLFFLFLFGLGHGILLWIGDILLIYSLMGLVTVAKTSPYRGKLITSEGEETGTMILMAVGNGRLAGGGYQVAPQAVLDDGLLDAMVVLDVEMKDFGILMGELMNLGAAENRFVMYRQMQSFRIEAETPVHMNLDGEPILETSFNFQVLPQRLSFVLSETAPLSSTSND